MLDVIKQKYAYIESLKGKNLIVFLAVTFGLFIVVGAAIGYFRATTLNKSEVQNPENPMVQKVGAFSTYHGTVTFIGEEAYPEDKIKFSLNDSLGKEIILLRASDDKLSIAEGLSVTVTGKIAKTKNGKETLLQVTEVSIRGK